jgi:homoserine dehydrogenase
MKKVALGIFGFGCVGQGLYHVLSQTKGVKAEVKKICVKDRDKKRPLPDELFTFKKNDILFDPHIDVVVELIDDAEAAYEIIKLALKSGKHVVTANKYVIAHHLRELVELQRQYNRSLLYEGAVCGSIPIIRNLEEYYDNDLIEGISGIFNGSTNYILTKVFEEKKSYSDALKQAQALGFAETNPDLDVKGFDPKFKLAITITHAFGLFVNPSEIINIGIDKISELDIKHARQKKCTIKLVAQAVKAGDKIHALVAPQLVEEDHILYAVKNEYNAVLVQGAFAEKQLFVGKGAGGNPTGSAVLSDISALTYQYHYEYKKLHQSPEVSFSNDIAIEAIVSAHQAAEEQLGSAWEVLHQETSANGLEIRSGCIQLNTLREWSARENVSILLPPQAKFRARQVELEPQTAGG